MSEGLFDAPDPLTFVTGQRVRVQTISGVVPATFLAYCREDSFPMACVRFEGGDETVINLARVRQI